MSTNLRKYEEMIKIIITIWKSTREYLHPTSTYNHFKNQMDKKSHIEVAPFTFISKYKINIVPYKLEEWSVEAEIHKYSFDFQEKIKNEIKIRQENWLNTTLWNLKNIIARLK
jgi:flagellar assembly factor FliW